MVSVHAIKATLEKGGAANGCRLRRINRWSVAGTALHHCISYTTLCMSFKINVTTPLFSSYHNTPHNYT